MIAQQAEMSGGQDRRCHERDKCDLTAHIELHPLLRVRCTVKDLSETGVKIAVSAAVHLQHEFVPLDPLRAERGGARPLKPRSSCLTPERVRVGRPEAAEPAPCRTANRVRRR